jgi:ADP-ribose pyrophosphatase YjhB (NUDIX family)
MIVRNKDGHVLLVQHSYRNRGVWSLPSGMMGSREAPIEAAQRELREEVQCILEDAAVVEFEYVEWLGTTYRTIVVEGATDTAPTADLREIEQVGFFPLSELPTPLNHNSAEHLERWQLRNSMPLKVPSFVRLEYVASRFAAKGPGSA